MIFRGSIVLNRCAHSVYIVPADWQAQAAWKIPASKRIAWFCWWCRDYEAFKFSEEKLMELARANSRPIRLTDSATVLIKNADYDDSDADILPDDAEPEEVEQLVATN